MRNRQGLFLAGGMPNAQLFPFSEISVTYSDGTHKKLVEDDLFSALQYGASQGYVMRMSEEIGERGKEREREMFCRVGKVALRASTY